MPGEEKHTQLQSELEKYRILLHATLDYCLEHYTGSIVFDQWDPSADHFLQQKNLTEKNFQERKLDSLQQMFGQQIERVRNRSDLYFTNHLKQKTGYEIDVKQDVPNFISETNAYVISVSESEVVTKSMEVQVNREVLTEEEMIDLDKYLRNRPTEFNFQDSLRKVRVSTNGTGEHALTEVVIMLRGGSGCIYCARGKSLPIKAFWKDKSTVVIQTKKEYPIFMRHAQVSSFNDVIKIEYIES